MSVDGLPRSDRAVGESHPSRGRILLIVLFVVSLALLAWVVLWKLEVPYVGGGDLRQVKLVPFVPSACDGASAPSEVVANVLLFIPFGLFLGLLAPAWPWWRIAGTIAAASLALEVAQYVLAVGSSDVTDLVTNTVGGLAGLGLLALVRRRLGRRTVPVLTRVLSVLTVLALLATAFVVASPVSFGPQHDVVVSSHALPRLDRDESREQHCR